jgi:hypothetical protein
MKFKKLGYFYGLMLGEGRLSLYQILDDLLEIGWILKVNLEGFK